MQGNESPKEFHNQASKLGDVPAVQACRRPTASRPPAILIVSPLSRGPSGRRVTPSSQSPESQGAFKTFASHLVQPPAPAQAAPSGAQLQRPAEHKGTSSCACCCAWLFSRSKRKVRSASSESALTP